MDYIENAVFDEEIRIYSMHTLRSYAYVGIKNINAYQRLLVVGQ